MIMLRAALQTLSRRPQSATRSVPRSRKAYSDYAIKRQQHFLRSVGTVTTLGLATALYQYSTTGSILRDVQAESPPAQTENVDLIFETSKYKDGVSKEETRSLISSQHLQVKKSWENPGVWCWGANDGKVAAPDAKDSIIKNPRWLPCFDGILFRDLKLTRDFGAAINEQGDLLQWGTAFSESNKEPEITLAGKDLISLAISKDRIIALARGGHVYSLSVSQEEQQLGPKPQESAWYGLSSRQSPISYRSVKPKDLGWSEKVTKIDSGLEHALLLTSKGRLFAAASSSESFPSRGQLGIPGLTWFTRPEGPYDMPHEVTNLHDFKIEDIATGDYHSIVLDRKGRVFSWGDNQKGQLGLGDTGKDAVIIDAPTLLPITKLYKGTSMSPRVTSIHAGGNTTFLTIDATRIVPSNADVDTISTALRGVGNVTADTWACGHGIWGQLGNGRFTHVQALPTKIPVFSGLFEWDEQAHRAVPIRIRQISVGSNHCAAVLDNVTYIGASDKTSENDTNWGADVLFFGNNEYFQLGTGKRNNMTTPTYIPPMDRNAEVQEGGRPREEMHRFHATPKSTVRFGNRWVNFEQRVVCGRGVTAVYSGI